VSYANKNNSPYIDVDAFLDFLGKYAKKHCEEHPEWLKWANDRSKKFWAEMAILVEEDKCELLTDTDEGRIYMPYFYLEVIKKAYQRMEEDADLPFPCEESLKITMPENQLKLLGSEYDIIEYMGHPQDSDIPILKFNFHEECGYALALASMVPRIIIETAILKLRNYLRKSGNMEFAIRKLAAQLQGKESYLRGLLNQILMRPLECYSAIEGGGEFSSLFWAHFCILIKNDIRKKKERLAEDIAAFQSVTIIEAISEHFKAMVVKKQEAELAFKSLENHLAQPPYLYAMEKILMFTNNKGVLLLGQYTEDELGEWLKDKTTKSKDNQLPDLLIVQGSPEERFYLCKDKMIPLCSKLLADSRQKAKDEITKNWRKLLLEYLREPPMNSDAEFDVYLTKVTGKLCPNLIALLEDPKLPLVCDEIENNPTANPSPVKLFNKGVLLPYSTLLYLNRKEILTEARLVLPFWYSLPIITPIIAFFKNLARRRNAPKLIPDIGTDGEPGARNKRDRAGEIRAAADALESDLVPTGYTLDSYLEELENRWSQLINQKARENLIEDVKSLIRDNLRQHLKLKKYYRFTHEIIHQMAVGIVTFTPTLSSLSGRESLVLYSELYLIKLLKNIK